LSGMVRKVVNGAVSGKNCEKRRGVPCWSARLGSIV
jgi:hypothetical protein